MTKRIIVVYKSVYGSTSTYAAWISRALDARLARSKEVTPVELGEYDTVIYGGGLYAGGIAGVKLITKTHCKNLIIFTVGLADPNTTNYSTIIDRLSPEIRANAQFFHLRGGVDYKRLSIIHRIMMAMKKREILKKSANELTGEDREFLETYGCQIDFCDKESIKPLIDYVQSYPKKAD